MALALVARVTGRILSKRDFRFVPTEAEGRTANLIGGVFALFCAILSLLVLLLAAYIWFDSRTKHHLDKTSTKLLFYCVAISVAQGLAYAATCINVGKHELAWCRTGMVGVIFGFNMANWLQCCICVNLVLALKRPIVFKYNVLRWYWTSGLVVSFLTAFVPLFYNQYQWDRQNHSCWIVDDGQSLNRWQIGVLETPILLVTVFMFISTGVVSHHLFMSKRAGKTHTQMLNQLYEPAFDSSVVNLSFQPETGVNNRFEIEEIVLSEDFKVQLDKYTGSSPEIMRSPLKFRAPGSISSAKRNSPSRASSMFSGIRGHGRRGKSHPSSGLDDISEAVALPKTVRVARMPVGAHFGADPVAEEAHRLRVTIARIACYPIIHLLISVLSPFGSLVLSQEAGASRRTQFALYIMTFVGSAWTPLAYSICALTAETSLWDGLGKKRRLRRGWEEENLELALGKNKHRLSQNLYSPSSVGIVGASPAVSLREHAGRNDFESEDEESEVERTVHVSRAPNLKEMTILEEEGEVSDE